MIFSKNRDKLRQTFYDVWQKTKNKTLLEPLEIIIRDVLLMHPEYHNLLEQKDLLKKDFTPEVGESNPFLHMSMHIAIKEQVQAKQPTGIEALFEKALKSQKDIHKAEHIFLECLGESLWLARKANQLPDEQQYLNCVKKKI